MTPKIKAKQLVDRYMTLFSQELENSISTMEAKECALVAVDLVRDSGILEPQLKRHYINGVEPEVIHLEYWVRVKQEIEKL